MKTCTATLLVVAALLGACQRTAESETPAVSAADAPRTATVVPAPSQPKPPTVAADATLIQSATATPQMQEFLKQYDLSPLWLLVPDETLTRQIFNGFFGSDKYRIEFVFTNVERDPQHPNVFRVRGKDRFRKTITPFEGTVVLKQLADQPPFSEARKQELAEQGYDFDGYPNSYSATGSFVFREEASRGNAGEFKGNVVLDFRVDEEGKIQRYTSDGQISSKGAGVLLTGNWTGYSSGQRKPLLLAGDILGFGPQVFSDFTIGGRDVEINPKYARLGWSSYWENDEWWAETPPTAKL